jgi:hypothetical protein
MGARGGVRAPSEIYVIDDVEIGMRAVDTGIDHVHVHIGAAVAIPFTPTSVRPTSAHTVNSTKPPATTSTVRIVMGLATRVA